MNKGMQYTFGIWLLLATPFLAGCKTSVEVEVTVMDLLFGQTRMLEADLRTQVTDCQTGDDAAASPGSLAERQRMISEVWPDAEYQTCVPRDGSHSAQFRIPIALDKDRDGKLASDQHINLVSSEDALLMLAVPDTLRARIDRVFGEGLRARYHPIEARIRILNDHGNAIPLQVFSVYVDEEPHIFGDITLRQNGSIRLRLSDVTIDNALDKRTSIILMR
ncbi:hypothetical protein ABC977_05865 [Thioalkalicoccus limnaeus]|uniref:DUF7424 domain-containing protein n=1 Tax=Thioalkalicoccus limnaeus TaxID=120681 RepID=A0ABV4BDN0_9GAMM